MFFNSVKLNENTALIKINHEIDNNFCSDLKKEIIKLVSEKIIFININLENSEFINVAGIGLLLSIHFELEKLSGRLVIEDPKMHISDLFEATQATKYLIIENKNEE